MELNGTVNEMKKVLENVTSTTALTSVLPVASTPVLTYISPVASASPVTLTPVFTSPVASTPVLTSPVASTPVLTSPVATISPTEPAAEIEIAQSDLIPNAEVMQILMKSCSQMNFAAKLSVRLFDEETRLTHNVAGRGKP